MPDASAVVEPWRFAAGPATRRPFPVATALRVLQRGAHDPAFRAESAQSAHSAQSAESAGRAGGGAGSPGGAGGAGVWLTLRVPSGAGRRGADPPDAPDAAGHGATVRLVVGPDGIVADAWGPGADWAIASVPDLLGAADDPSGFRPAHPRVADAWHRHPDLRLPRTGRVWESLLPAILEQRVTGKEAWGAWSGLLAAHGDPAPGPAPTGMRVAPPPSVVRAVPDWEWHRLGVDGARRRTVRAAAAVADRLRPGPGLAAALRTIPGVGPWTVAETLQRALGDPDAVSVGDFHLPGLVGWALAGRPVDDAGMLELLEPYAGHRYRAVRLLEVGGFRTPRFGPRYAPQDMRRF